MDGLSAREFATLYEDTEPAPEVCQCGHARDEHQPACVAIVEEHERRVYCMCPAFELDEEALRASTGGYRD